jgi:hypothetical protein
MQRTTENCNCGSIHWRAKPFISSDEFKKIILWLNIIQQQQKPTS